MKNNIGVRLNGTYATPIMMARALGLTRQAVNVQLKLGKYKTVTLGGKVLIITS